MRAIPIRTCKCVRTAVGVQTRLQACGCIRTSTFRYTADTGRWLVSKTFLCLLVIALVVILSQFPLRIPSPTTHWPNTPRVLFPNTPRVLLKTIGGGLPSSIMGARRRKLRLARGSADSVCLCGHCYHHAPPRPHTRPHTLTTPLHATTLHSHLLPAHIPAAHSHLYFGYRLPVTARIPGLVPTVAKDRADRYLHSTHSINTCQHPTPTRLGQVYKRALVVHPSSPHHRAFVCGACTGTAEVWRLGGVPFRSTLQTI